MDLPLTWIVTPHIRPDHRGPVDRPYRAAIDPADASPITEMLRAVSLWQPDATAVDSEAGPTTYAQLWRAVCRASRLITRALPEAAPVAIVLPTSVQYMVAVYACVAARRPCIALDASHPVSRNAAIVEAVGAGLVLVSADRGSPSAWGRVKALSLAEAFDAKSGEAGADATATGPAASPLGLDEPAFVLCTSGSAGQPKPIVHSQRTILHWTRTTHDAFHLRADDRVLSLSSYATLGGFTGLLSFSLAGASTQMFELKAGGLGGLLETLATRPVTIVRAVPSMLRGLARLDEARAACVGLRAVHTYGEPLMKVDLAELARLLPAGCLVRSVYGSTEASGLAWFAGEPDDHDPLRVASGTLMPDTAAAIVDDEGRSCPPGVAGELWIRSRYNALGEWADGGLVAGRLEADPRDAGERIFRSGDLARQHDDGVFVVLGRKDRMVKINGQRIEPAEIEAVLRGHEAVLEAEIVVVGAAPAARLIAFVVPRAETGAGLGASLRSLLRARLPAHMVPSRIVTLAAMPRLPGGKVDAMTLLADLSGERAAAKT